MGKSGDTLPPLQPKRQGDAQHQFHYTVRHPWQWVMAAVATEGMAEVQNTADLPSAKLVGDGTPAPEAQTPPVRSASTRRRRQAKERRAAIPSTLRIDITNPKSGELEDAVHGSSAALDSLEDKDELVRTIQRCRCEHLNISPPSVLINWDVSKDECKRVLGESLPVLPGNTNEVKYAVLKEPMGSRGEGVFFVKDAEEIHKTVSEHRQRAQKEPGFLDQLISAKGRIPSWVLQAEVTPCLLVNEKHKFHLRTYLVVLEKLGDPDAIDVFVFNRHEVRMATTPVSNDPSDRDRQAHITNGSFCETTKRVLLSSVTELAERGMQDKVETFVCEVFGKHLLPDMLGRVNYNSNQENGTMVRKFAIAGVDMMVAADDRIYLLEVNVNPAAPPENLVDSEFREHLTGFMQDLLGLIMGRLPPNFHLASEVLERKGLLD